MRDKHAYLIMAHNEFDILEKQLILLDDYRNDIYIHIDKKVKGFDFDYYKTLMKKSNLFYVERIDVRWGDFSQIECELILLKQSILKNYRYYHLISGVDMPLKIQDEIYDFFKNNDGLEFVHFCTEEQTINVRNRVLQYHFMRWCRTKNKYVNYIPRIINAVLRIAQSKANFKRKWDKNIKLQYGANWFSITHELAEYVISKEDWINKYFRHTLCGDELFLQTIVYNSKFRNRLYKKEMNNDYTACMRYIDWERGGPYVFRKEDFQELINSDRIFARKFSSKVDNEIINNIFNYLLNKKNSIRKNNQII